MNALIREKGGTFSLNKNEPIHNKHYNNFEYNKSTDNK